MASRNGLLVAVSLKFVLFLVLASLLTLVVVASLLDLDTSPSRNYKALFSDASEIEHGDPVRIAGVKVGRITSVALRGKEAVVSFSVDSAQHVTAATRVQIQFENLFGQRNLGLTDGGSGPALPSGSTIPLARTQPGLDLTDLFVGFQPLFQALTPTQINQLSANIIGAFQGQGNSIASLVSESAQLTTNLAGRQQVIDQVVDNLTTLLGTVGAHDTQLGQLVDNFSQLTTNLAGERGDLGSAIGSAQQLTTALNGLVGSIQAPLETSVHNFTSVTAALNAHQKQLNGLINSLPPAFTAVDKVTQTGGFANVYLCGLYAMPNDTLTVSPLSLPQNMQSLLNNVGNVLTALGVGPAGHLAGVNVKLPEGLQYPLNNHTPNCQVKP